MTPSPLEELAEIEREMREVFHGPGRYLRYGAHYKPSLDVIADKALAEWAARLAAARGAIAAMLERVKVEADWLFEHTPRETERQVAHRLVQALKNEPNPEDTHGGAGPTEER